MALVSAFWVVVGLVWGTQRWISDLLVGAETGLGWELGYALLASVAWIPVTLAILWLARRFPLTPDRWRRTLPVHAVASLATAVVSNALMVLVAAWAAGRLVPPDFGRVVLAGSVEWVHMIALVYFAMVGVTALLLHRSAMQRRELALARLEADLARARLRTLSAQLRPHFLLNVLHGIGQLWRTGRAREADRMLEGLGDLFRKILSRTDERRISLEEEIGLAREYLELEGIRFADRMEVRFEVAPEVAGLAVPPLLLQPLVENAVQHGVGGRAGSGRVTVRALRRDGRLRLEVEDDGPGPGGARPAVASGEDGGVGLENVRARLAEEFGDAASLGLEATEAGGARAWLELPAEEPALHG